MIYFKGVGTVSSGVGNVTPTWPTHSANDFALLLVQSSNQTISTPSGWTELSSSPQGTGTAATSGAVRLAVFYRIATSSAETNPTVTDTGNHTIARIVVYQGVDTLQPINTTVGTTQAASTTGTFSAVTTTCVDAMILLAIGHAIDRNSTTIFSGWTNSNLTDIAERIDNGTNSGTGGGFGLAEGREANVSNIGSSTVTLSSSSAKALITIALKPATGFMAAMY